MRFRLVMAYHKKSLLNILGIDIEGAYDNVNLEELLKILDRINIATSIKRFVYNLIMDREVYGFFNNISFAPGKTNKGLPQGCILSPLLFNIYISDIIHHLTSGIRYLGFADDLLIYFRNEDPSIIIDKLTSCINSLNGWLEEKNLRISIPKCSLIFLGYEASKIPQGTHKIIVNTNIIPNGFSFKYLGVTWDSFRDWGLHINNTIKLFRLGVNLLSSLCRRSWGIHPQTALTFYKAIVRPRVD